MIESLYQIDFIDSSGGTTRLLSIGDLIAAHIEFPAKQSANNFASIGSVWGGVNAAGGARRPITFSRLVEHSSHAIAASWSVRYPASLPLYRDGKLRVTISGGETWDLLDAIILDASAKPDSEGDFSAMVTFNLEAGESVPVSGVAHYAGIPHAWIMTKHEDQTLTHANL